MVTGAVAAIAAVMFGWESFKWIAGLGEPDSFLIGAALVATTLFALRDAIEALIERGRS